MAATTMAPLSAQQHSAELRKAVIAATVGTTIEWYDFFIYGTAAGLVFGKPMTLSPCLNSPRFFNNSTLSKRFSTFRFVVMVLAPFRLRCCDIVTPESKGRTLSWS